MIKMKYPKIQEREDNWSEWIKPVMKGYKIKCCDCGLVHKFEFRINSGNYIPIWLLNFLMPHAHIEYRASRDNRATGQARRYKGRLLVLK